MLATHRLCSFLVLGTVFSLVLVGAVAPAPPAVAATPDGFADNAVATVSLPTALAFTPDGRLLITSQSGRLWVYRDGELNSSPALDLSARVCSNGERGLLGVAVDPAFGTNQRIYLYFTEKIGTSCPTGDGVAGLPINRVSRFTLGSDGIVDPASETVIVGNIPSIRGNHNGGDLHFGADGYLYVSVGESGVSSNAPSLETLAGKILRVDTAGRAPASNPFVATAGSRRCGDPAATSDSGVCQEIFAYGLRNPFRLAFRPGTSDFYVNDVGQNTWEEIDQGIAGANYGWPEREGDCATGSKTDCGPPPAGLTNPIFSYGRDTGCRTITGGAFVPAGIWPTPYDGAYLFADFICGSIFRLAPNGPGSYTMESFVDELGGNSVIDLQFGPDGTSQSLFYATYANGGEVRRISASAFLTPTSVIGLPVVLNGQP